MHLSCWKRVVRHYLNRKKATAVGTATLLQGTLDIRHPQGKIVIGNGCLVQGTLVAETESSQITLGNNVYVGGGTVIDCVQSITIADDVLISYGCVITDSDNHSIRYSIRKKDLADWRNGGVHDWHTTNTKPTVIAKGVWIGTNAIILKGVMLGEGAVIGAGSVVTKDVPPYTVVAGNPARVIRELAPDER